MKIGIISFAHMHAYSYANALKQIDHVSLSGIFDEDVERGKKFADLFETNFYPTYEMLLNQDLDAVIITSENAKHHEHVLAAAKAKKHILCEKPLSTTIEDAQEMIEVCQECGVKLQLAFPVRFNTSILRAKDIIDSGKIGRILAIKGTNRGTNPGGWFVEKEKSGGGAVIDHTVHVVDIMRWFMKAEVSEVYAEIGQLFTDTPIDDAGILSMEFNNGVFATLDCSWSRNRGVPKGGDVTLEIVGTKGTLNLDAFNQNVHVFSKENGVTGRFWGDSMDQALIKDFINNVTVEKEPTITGMDGLKAVEVALAAYESSKKTMPVKLMN